MIYLFKVTGAARGTSSGLEHPTYLLNLRVSDLEVTRILHKICTIKYTSFNEKKLKNFQGGACTLPPSVPQTKNGTTHKCIRSENSGYASVHSVHCVRSSIALLFIIQKK